MIGHEADEALQHLAELLRRTQATADVPLHGAPSASWAITLGAVVIPVIVSLASGVGVAWLARQRNVMTRDEVTALIRDQGPYVEERKAILDRLDRATADVQRISDDVKGIAAKQAEMSGTLTVLSAQLNTAILQAERRAKP